MKFIRGAGWILIIGVVLVGCSPALSVEPTTALPQPPATADVSGPADGYVLFGPMFSISTYLIDNDGRVVHQWDHDNPPGNSVYLLENGHLMRAENIGVNNIVFEALGGGGRIAEYTWEGKEVWAFAYVSDTVLQHHDIEPLPNGNVLLIAWELKTRDEVLAAGRSPDLLDEEHDGELWVDHVVEVVPQTGEVVWEWHAWDHLIQDADPDKDNYGVVADHPELIDLNYDLEPVRADWLHANGIDYNAELDQIVVSLRDMSEIWVIDHSTTSEEAAGHSGGRYGKGGDLLYRWGNPAVYRAGDAADRQLVYQHNAQWIDADLPGGGHMLIFDNGDPDERFYSRVVEMVPPLNEDGSYDLPAGMPSQPAGPVWEVRSDGEDDWFSAVVSGAQRQPNGNTLVCAGPLGLFMEFTAEGEILWRYENPVYGKLRDDWVNTVFRAERYPPDYAGFDGKDLTPDGYLNERPHERPTATPEG